MKILVIGSNSVVGRAIGRNLKEQHRVAYAGRKDADIYFDLNLPLEQIKIQERFDTVIFCAGFFNSKTENDIINSVKINATGVLNACIVARACNSSHFILISSIFAPSSAKDPYFDSYSVSKQHGEELASLYCHDFNIPLTILRPSAIYDEKSKCMKHQFLFYHILDRVQQNSDVIIFGTNNSKRNYIYIDDVSNAVKICVNEKITGLYNCIGHPTTLVEIIQTACDVFKTNSKIEFDASREDIPDFKIYNAPSIFEKSSILKRTSLHSGIKTIKSYREKNG